MSDEKNFAPKSAPHAAFAVREGSLAARLGITRDILRALRQEHLQENLHFARLRKKIHYTEEACELLRARINLAPAEMQQALQAAQQTDASLDEADDEEAQRANAEHPDTVTLKVWRTFHVEQKDGTLKYNGVIEAYHPHTDPSDPNNIVRVFVGSGKNYVRHMEIPAKRLNGDMYEIARPDPRFRGWW